MDQERVQAIRNSEKNSVAIARFFLEEYPYFVLDKIALEGDGDGKGGTYELYDYDPNSGLYKYIDDSQFDRYYMNFILKYGIDKIWKINRINEIKRAIFALNKLPEVEFDSKETLLLLNNGIYDIIKDELYEFSPTIYFRTKIDVDYERGATSRAFAQFLMDCFRLSENTYDIETVESLIKIGGYLLYPKNKLKLMFLFLGEGSNGKSILSDIYQMFFHKGGITHLDLNTLSSSSSLEREKIIGSRFNVTTEAKSDKLDSEMIKKIISSEGIMVTRKFKVAVSYRPITKILVASNMNPYFNDTTHGIYRRIHPVTFPNRFVPKAEYRKFVNPEKKNIYLARDEDEMFEEFRKDKSGIFNMFIAGLRKIIDNNWQLEKSANSQATLDEYKDASDNLGYFLRQYYEEFDEESDEDSPGVSANEVLEHYRIWHRDNVSETALRLGVQSIGKKIKELFRVESKRSYINKKDRVSLYPIKRINYAERELLSIVPNDESASAENQETLL